MNENNSPDSSNSPIKATKRRSAPATLLTCAVFPAAAAALYFAAGHIPGFADAYASKVYPLWQGSLGRAAGIFPFSLSEMVLYSLPVLLIVDIIFNRRKLLRVLKHLAVFVSVLLFLYTANCGVNYYRTAFSKTEGLEQAEPTKELLTEFCGYVADKLIEENAAGFTSPDISTDELAREAKAAMENLGETYPTLSGYYPDPKPILNSEPFSAMGVTGIYSPFTIEANYNRDITAYNLPYTACHELSHLKGYMNEQEANYIGWLACMGSDDARFNHSAWMMAWIYGGNALARTDHDAFTELYRTLPESVVAELQENNLFWQEHETKASEIQDSVNDAYLKANGQENGILDYGRVVNLMLSWYSQNIL